MSEGTTRQTKLTDSEAKMLRERVEKCDPPLFRDEAFEFASDLLSRAKEKAASFCDDPGDDGTLGPVIKRACAYAIRNSDWGDLFEVK